MHRIILWADHVPHAAAAGSCSASRGAGTPDVVSMLLLGPLDIDPEQIALLGGALPETAWRQLYKLRP